MSETSKSGRGRGTRVTQEQYDVMVAVHRNNLGDHSQAAREAGVAYNTARKAFEKGLNKGEFKPIRSLIHREMLEARSKIQSYGKAAIDENNMINKARADLIQTRAAQAQALRLSRTNSILAMSMSSNLLMAAQKLSEQVQQLFTDECWKPSPGQAISLLRAVAQISRDCMESTNISLEMERRCLGDPEILPAKATMTPEEAVVTIENGVKTWEKLKQRSLRAEAMSKTQKEMQSSMKIIEKNSEKIIQE